MKKEDVRDCICDISYEDITQWSIVYDLQKKTLDFYWQRKYDDKDVYRFELN